MSSPATEGGMSALFAFVAGFFRESGATESSTRLVGIASFAMALTMSGYVVVTKTADASSLGVIAMSFTYGAIALGLRKGDDAPTPPAP